MKAVQFDRFGEPAQVLQVREIESPQPKTGELLVRMLLSPVNPSDLMTIRGVYGKQPHLPCTPGYEGVGIVEASGGGLLGKMLVGKRVALLNGISAEQVQSVAQRYFVDEQLSVAQLIPLPVNPQAPRRSAGHIRH